MNFYSLLLVLSLSFFISTPPSFAAGTPPDEAAPLSFEHFLPPSICAEDVVSYTLVEAGSASNIYAVKTADGKTVYHVVASVTLELLPTVVEYACIAIIKHPLVCKSVYLAGEALVVIFEDDIMQKVDNFWASRIFEGVGYSSLFTTSVEEAQDGQLAFEASADKTEFPWTAPIIRPFYNAAKRYGSDGN